VTLLAYRFLRYNSKITIHKGKKSNTFKLSFIKSENFLSPKDTVIKKQVLSILARCHSNMYVVVSHCGFNLHSLTINAEKAMAPHSSTLAWKIPWTEEPGRLQSMGSRRVGHD